MRLFLIRHGETVDNIAQLYAGTRDSELTNHGVLQATKLGQSFQVSGIRITHLFSSPLKRAVKTAKLVQDAQSSFFPDATAVPALDSSGSARNDTFKLEIVRCQALIEQDFGFYEGKPFYERPRGENLTGKQAHQRNHENEPGFVPPESKESMARRGDSFLDEHLLPLLHDEHLEIEPVVAVVSHGILLSSLWKCFLRRLPARSVGFAPTAVASQSFTDLEHLGGWSNTGYLELRLSKYKTDAINKKGSEDLPASSTSTECGPDLSQRGMPSQPDHKAVGDSTAVAEPVGLSVGAEVQQAELVAGSSLQPGISESFSLAHEPIKLIREWTTTIMTVNEKSHLRGLKRTGGGVGSAKFEEGQKTLETFFKRRKVG
ncbi:phosphoglycerate mutase-like protein [Viridothelium virens]|uniref:Phosphoglycerate mutase-like protein n=1 Tax=Viridothelium virens TaxID=1048519 RepID=A0A6A6GTN3_VIRVR|nr:phosphoglycerate mutase-like protein [Viridothelium virens]